MPQFIRSNLIFIIALALMPVCARAAGYLDDYIFRIMMLAGINILLATSLNLVNGITGQFSLGHAGFMAVGAYVSASITYYVGRGYFQPVVEASGDIWWAPFTTQIFFFAAIFLGGCVSALLGFLVGLPSLRLRGDYLAIVTLGFGEIIRVLILNIEAVGGARGFVDIPVYTNFYWVYGAVVFSVVIMVRLVRSAHGRAFLAVREDEIAAESVGVSTTRYKVLAFVVSSFFAGVAGALFAHFNYLNPSIFSFIRSIEIIIMVVLGGLGSFSGSIIAAIFLTALPELLRSGQETIVEKLNQHIQLSPTVESLLKNDYRMVIYSLLLIIVMLTRPNGLFGIREIWDIARRRKVPT